MYLKILIHVGARFPVNEDEYLILLEFEKGIVSQKEINDRIYDFARKLYEYINREEKTVSCILLFAWKYGKAVPV